MIGDDKLIAALRAGLATSNGLLREVLLVLEAGSDFQLGPKGRHRDLVAPA